MVIPDDINIWKLQALFLVALRNEDTETCNTLLAAGADCDQMFKVNGGYHPALSIAVATKEIPLVKLLLKKGASINLPGSNGATCLHAAIKTGSTRVCKLLIKHHANIDAVDNCGLRPIHLAAQRGSIELTNLLLTAGANVNYVDQAGKSALHYACAAPVVVTELVKTLMKHGAKLDENDESGLTPLQHLVRKRNYSYELVRLFVLGGARISVLNGGMSLLHWVVHFYSPDRLKCIELLLQHGCDPDLQTDSGQTALYMCVNGSMGPCPAAGRAGLACLRVLLLANANPYICDIRGYSPLAIAFELSNIAAVNMLLTIGFRATPEVQKSLRMPMPKLPCFLKEAIHIFQRLETPPKLTELARGAIYKKYGPWSEEKIKELINDGQLPVSLKPLLLLETDVNGRVFSRLPTRHPDL